MAPYLAVTFIISMFGIFPSPTSGGPGDQPFMAELKLVAFDFAPKSWALCNGQLLPINQNQALFSLLGTTYGGNGQTTFGLPDLRGRVPVHRGSVLQGESAGQEFHTLTMNEMPAHVHPVGCVAGQAGQAASTGNVWGTSGLSPYSGSVNSNMNPACVTNTGGSQPHSNLQPYLTLNYVIALQGIFPSHS
jgi:microcystin-dependent protein